MAAITKRSNGTYRARIKVGVRQYKDVYGKTQKEVKKKAEEIESQLRKGLSLDNDSVEIWIDYFLRAKSTEVSESQYDLIKTRAEFWKDEIGSLNIKDVRPVDLQPVFNELARCNPTTKEPTAKRTLLSYRQIIRSAFDYAIDNRIIDYNPADKIKVPQTASQNERRALTDIERQRVIEFEHRGQLAQMLMMFSGLRRGEAAALLWSDVDLINNTISVTKSFNYKEMKLKPPKNGKPRLVSIPQVLSDYLKKQPHKSDYVVTSAKGERMSESAWKRMLEAYFVDYNLKYGRVPKDFQKFSPEKIPMSVDTWTWHCLRHTFATIMYNSGVNVLTAQEQLGHSDPKITMEIYTHLEEEKKKKDISLLNDYLNLG